MDQQLEKIMTVTILQAPALDIDALMLKKYNYKVSPTGKLERRIVWNLLNYLTEKGFRVFTVDTSDELVDTADNKAVMEVVFDLDQADLHVEPIPALDATGSEIPSDVEHVIRLVMGNGVDMISDWIYTDGDPDGFKALMDAFDTEDYA